MFMHHQHHHFVFEIVNEMQVMASEMGHHCHYYFVLEIVKEMAIVVVMMHHYISHHLHLVHYFENEMVMMIVKVMMVVMGDGSSCISFSK